MPKRFFKKPKKDTCASCGNPLEAEVIGKNVYCRSCWSAYMRRKRADRKEEVEKLREFYNLHHSK